MNRSPVNLRWLIILPLLAVTVAAQSAPNDQMVAPPVSYSSISQLNSMLTQLEQASQATQTDLSKMRIDRWKTDSGTKKQTQSNIESLQRNLQGALPEMVGQLKSSPENLTSTFKLYRNLDALYNVFGSVVEAAGAFGSKDEFQSLENDLSSLERSRRVFAERMETLAGAKEQELTRLRTQVQSAQSAASAAPPKKVIVDDNEPPKKTTKKKTVPKPPKTPTATPDAQSQPH